MTPAGELTSTIARKLSIDWEERGYRVLYDHDPSSENVGNIASWFGEAYKRETQLSQIDIAIVEKGTDKVFALIEIEETNDRPKTFLGDAFGVLMGEHIRFGGEPMSVNEHTTLIVLGKSDVLHETRNQYLREKIMGTKSSLGTANSKIGDVVIGSFSNEQALDDMLKSKLEQAFKRGL